MQVYGTGFSFAIFALLIYLNFGKVDKTVLFLEVAAASVNGLILLLYALRAWRSKKRQRGS